MNGNYKSEGNKNRIFKSEGDMPPPITSGNYALALKHKIYLLNWDINIHNFYSILIFYVLPKLK